MRLWFTHKLPIIVGLLNDLEYTLWTSLGSAWHPEISNVKIRPLFFPALRAIRIHGLPFISAWYTQMSNVKMRPLEIPKPLIVSAFRRVRDSTSTNAFQTGDAGRAGVHLPRRQVDVPPGVEGAFLYRLGLNPEGEPPGIPVPFSGRGLADGRRALRMTRELR